MKPEYITRHKDLISEDAMNKKIIIVGAGAIGGFVTLALAKMGYSNIHVYDFDTVEPENIGNQFFDVSCIGQKKTDALRDMVLAFTGININVYDKKLDIKMDQQGERLNANIVISAVDSMSVRGLIAGLSDCYWLIDPRMGAEYATMNVVDFQSLSELASYTKSLFSDEEAVRERCTAKTTIYTVLLIAGQVVKAVKDITNVSQVTPITSMDWNIRQNAMVAFSNGRKL